MLFRGISTGRNIFLNSFMEFAFVKDVSVIRLILSYDAFFHSSTLLHKGVADSISCIQLSKSWSDIMRKDKTTVINYWFFIFLVIVTQVNRLLSIGQKSKRLKNEDIVIAHCFGSCKSHYCCLEQDLMHGGPLTVIWKYKSRLIFMPSA